MAIMYTHENPNPKWCFMKSLILIFVFCFLNLSQSFAHQKPYFQTSYEESRTLFRELSQQTAGSLSTFAIPNQKNEDLTMDALYLKNPNAKALIILAAGVHGSEGFTGSAALIDFLANTYPGLRSSDASFLLLHSINPYGQKYFRRVTENNVDLNRNFSLTDDLYQTPNPSYRKLNGVLNPQKRVTSYYKSTTRSTLGLLKALTLQGVSVDEIRQASVGGQYQYPKGIYYGGSKAEPQVQMLKAYLAPIVREYQNLMLLDFHTGLGENGQLYLISSASQTDSEKELMKKVFSRPGENTYSLSTSDDPGFYATTGDMTDFLQTLAPEVKMLSLTAEFGTLGLGIISQLKTINRLVVENQAHHFGAKSPKIARRVQKHFDELFHPTDAKWRDEVQRRTRLLLNEYIPRYLEQVK